MGKLSPAQKRAITTLRNSGLVVNLVLPETKAPGNTFYKNVIAARVPCAYSAPECVGKTFAPNGVGKFQHTTCSDGRKALAAR